MRENIHPIARLAIFFVFVPRQATRACPAGPLPGHKSHDLPHCEALSRTPLPQVSSDAQIGFALLPRLDDTQKRRHCGFGTQFQETDQTPDKRSYRNVGKRPMRLRATFRGSDFTGLGRAFAADHHIKRTCGFTDCNYSILDFRLSTSEDVDSQNDTKGQDTRLLFSLILPYVAFGTYMRLTLRGNTVPLWFPYAALCYLTRIHRIEPDFVDEPEHNGLAFGSSPATGIATRPVVPAGRPKFCR